MVYRMGQTVTLSPEQEHRVVDAVVAMDWSRAEAVGQTVVGILGLAHEKDILEVVRALERRRVIKPVANNVPENGPGVLKWVRGGIPTTHELVLHLTDLQEFTIDGSQRDICRVWGCSSDEAMHLLYDLRDRNILIHGANGRWCRPNNSGSA
jgi:hypothetical protein